MVVKKSVEYYHHNFGEKHQVLFRREETYDELIKTIFVIFGNKLFHDIYNKLKAIITTNCEITSTVVADFIDSMVEEIITAMPLVLKILLTIIYDKVSEVYLIQSYEPVMVVLFFNFLFNPKIQESNGFSISNERLRNMSMIIYKCCFNTKFKSNEKFEYLNKDIDEFSKKINISIECVILKTKQQDKDELYKNLVESIYTKGLMPPYWMFYVDCDYIMRVLNEFQLLENKRRITSNTNQSRKLDYIFFR